MVTTNIPPAALPPDEAAKYLGVTRSTFDRVAKAEPLPGIRMGNRRVFRVDMLNAYLKHREQQEIQSSGAAS